MSFQNLNLDPKILQALDSKGYTTPTPIQLQAIPHLLEGKDLLGIAQTGTGKTAAFSLPILQNLSKSNVTVKSGGVRTLILTPTRELASQIADNIELYGKDLGLRHVVIFGGVSEKPQITAMQRGVDILIATPGRLLDLMEQGYIRFMQLEIFVLDEADRMLDMGFINDIKKIIAKIPTKRQTLFFSATMPSTISELANSILKDPVKIEITPESTTVERIDQQINYVEKGNKSALLKRILKQEDAKSVLVFSKTKHGANRIEEFLLKSGITVAAIHGNKSQGAREKALDAFREGKVQVLIATDIAARGIDIPAITHVINYDIPMDPESYVHRIGRTARAGRQGIAISFCDPSETKLLQSVEKTIKYKIPVDETHPFHGVAAAPMERDARRDDREFDAQKGRKTFGHSINKDRRSSPSSSRSGDRDTRGNSSSRNEKGGERRSKPNSRDDKKGGGLLSFIGFGKKKTEAKSDSRPERSNRPSRAGSDRRFDSRPERSDRFDRPERSGRPERAGSDRRFDSRPERSDRRFESNNSDKKPIRNGNSIHEKETHNKTSFGFGWFGGKNKKSDSRSVNDSALGGRDRYGPAADRRSGSSFGGERRRSPSSSSSSYSSGSRSGSGSSYNSRSSSAPRSGNGNRPSGGNSSGNRSGGGNGSRKIW
jgi:ATP-dependent RNA helicase RhlE